MRAFLFALLFVGAAVGERATDDATLMAERAWQGEGDQAQQTTGGMMAKKKPKANMMAVMSKKRSTKGETKAKIMMQSLRKKKLNTTGGKDEKDRLGTNFTEIRLPAYQVTHSVEWSYRTRAKKSEKAFRCWAKDFTNFANFKRCKMDNVCPWENTTDQALTPHSFVELNARRRLRYWHGQYAHGQYGIGGVKTTAGHGQFSPGPGSVTITAGPTVKTVAEALTNLKIRNRTWTRACATSEQSSRQGQSTWRQG